MMRFLLPLAGAVVLLAAPANAGDRYAERPPVVVSPDIASK